MLSADQAVQILEGLEPAFVRAGERALALQHGIQLTKKAGTGDATIDAVTEADLAVQELILQAIVQTPLVDCHVFSEEQTPSVSNFTGQSPLILTLDPIDGTLSYANGSRHFRTVVGLRTTEEFLYTYVGVPGCAAQIRISGSTVRQTGSLQLEPNPAHAKLVVYTCPTEDPARMDAVSTELARQGYELVNTKSVRPGGSITLFLAGVVGGYFNGWPNVHDGYIAAHFAQAKGWPIHYRNLNVALNLSTLAPGRGSERFDNDYYVLREE